MKKEMLVGLALLAATLTGCEPIACHQGQEITISSSNPQHYRTYDDTHGRYTAECMYDHNVNFSGVNFNGTYTLNDGGREYNLRSEAVTLDRCWFRVTEIKRDRIRLYPEFTKNKTIPIDGWLEAEK